ncbi:MAG: protein kinase [Candidatus Acidiferrales bacterium]|jgi:Tol biopolymer transport system component
MALASGTRLGTYEVVGPLGVGGMGEVYRARDSKLRREVALKVLPDAFAADAERLGRFHREAQLLASLNHPNIAAIYGFEDSGNVHAFVMELVEGPTLADRVKMGAMPIGEALPIAKQICEALEFAHERGIVHRDLKPANVKVTPDGAVKVLDFGLAKALETQDAAANISNSPTLTIGSTRAGMILGTAAYMAPEQAKGRSADRRSDIWAFGCVLYEMLSGKQPFSGETVSDTLAEVLKVDPDWSALPADTPASIQKLLRRCLLKDPKQRLQAIGEARIAIEQTLNPSAQASASGFDVAAPVSVAAAAPAATQPPWRRALPWAAAALLFTTTALFAILYWREASVPARSVRSNILAPDQATFDFAASSGTPAVSPDGKRLVFVAHDTGGKAMLWVRELDSLSARPLEGTQGASFPFWSPDSLFVGFFASGKLMKIDVSGGPAQTVCDAPNGRGGAWSAGGVIVFTPKVSGSLEQVSAAGGSSTPLASLSTTNGLLTVRWPVFLPDGNHFLYWAGNPFAVAGSGPNGIYVASLDGKAGQFLFPADSDALYASGYLLFLRGETLMVQTFDAADLKLSGDAVPIAEHVANPEKFRLGHFSVSQHGELVYSEAEADRSQVAWLDSAGKQLSTVGDPGLIQGLRLSPDGKTLAEAYEDPQSSNIDLWLVDLARGVPTRLTFDPSAHGWPTWSPDGSEIAFSSTTSGNLSIYEKAANGTGNSQPLIDDTSEKMLGDWSRDGRYIAYSRLDTQGGGGLNIWILPLFGDKKPFPLVQSQFNLLTPAFSPDGKWLAYSSDESGKREVFVVSFPQGGGKWQVSSGGGSQPRWRADGKGLFYISEDNKLMSVEIQEQGASLAIGKTQTLFQSNAFTGTGASYDVTSDGRKFIVASPLAPTSTTPLTLVTNWSAALKKP